MSLSITKVEKFKSCKYRYYLHEVLERTSNAPNQDPDSPLYLGRAIHKGLEENSIQAAFDDYKSNFYCINTKHYDEMIKLQNLIPKALKVLNDDMVNVGHIDDVTEYEINVSNFVGYVDRMVIKSDGHVDIYDYKYTNTTDYKNTSQLHVYKFFLETLGFKVDKLKYLIIPKAPTRQLFGEPIDKYRRRLTGALDKCKPFIYEITYDEDKVKEFLTIGLSINKCKCFDRSFTVQCRYCEYAKLCEKGDINMNLPINEKKLTPEIKKRRIWCYGAPFSGKSTTFDKADNCLMLNTDGNTDMLTSPTIAIKDQVTMNGRIKEIQLAWEFFKEVVDELEKMQHTYKWVVVDLLEDIYEHCRIWGCQKLGIDHESENAQKAYDFVRAEFLREMRKLMNLPIENIVLVSHIDISKNIFKTNGDNITRIAPAINEKVANKIAGMVGLVTKIDIDGDNRYFSFKTDDVTFGGGRLNKQNVQRIPLDLKEMLEFYSVADAGNIQDHVDDTGKIDAAADKPKTRNRVK